MTNAPPYRPDRLGVKSSAKEIVREEEIVPTEIDSSYQSSRLVLLPNPTRLIYGRGSFVDAVSQRPSFQSRRGERGCARWDLCRRAAQG
jgi:hypothetical protein